MEVDIGLIEEQNILLSPCHLGRKRKYLDAERHKLRLAATGVLCADVFARDLRLQYKRSSTALDLYIVEEGVQFVDVGLKAGRLLSLFVQPISRKFELPELHAALFAELIELVSASNITHPFAVGVMILLDVGLIGENAATLWSDVSLGTDRGVGEILFDPLEKGTLSAAVLSKNDIELI